MQDYINFGWGTGFAVIMGFILMMVFLYSIVKIRKQASEAKKRQQNKEASTPEIPREDR